MKPDRVSIAAAALAILFVPSVAHATPSSTYWTPMTLDLQPYGVLHVGVDNYSTIFRKASDGAGDFPTDAGLTIGVLPFSKIQMEIGIDGLEPSDHPIFFNAKLGAPEGALFHGAPALQVGIFNAGTESGVTDQNIVQFVVGKSIAGFGRISAGPYIGNSTVLVDANGDDENTGFMIAFDRGFMLTPTADGGTFNRLVLAGDYASGKNALGGGGVGMYYYFHPDISFLAGPVWFNEEALNGKWKWTIQLDANRVVFGK